VRTIQLFPESTPSQNKAVISVAVVSIAVFVYIMLSADLLPLLGLHLPLLPAMAYVIIGSATLAAFCCFWYFRGLSCALIGPLGICTLEYTLTKLPALTIIGCFTMLLPCILASDRLLAYLRKENPGSH